MSSFDEREKSFEKKFAHDEELQFKVSARRNKYIGEWASKILGYNPSIFVSIFFFYALNFIFAYYFFKFL